MEVELADEMVPLGGAWKTPGRAEGGGKVRPVSVSMSEKLLTRQLLHVVALYEDLPWIQTQMLRLEGLNSESGEVFSAFSSLRLTASCALVTLRYLNVSLR